MTRRTAIRSSLTALAVGGLAGCQGLLGQSFEAEVTREDPRTVHVGQTIHGTLQEDDGEDPVNGKVAEPMELEVSEETQVTIGLTSEDFDTYLVVTQDDELVTEDDDGGLHFNSQLTTTLDAGTYTVWATSYLGRSTGDYTIALAEGTSVDVGDDGDGTESGDGHAGDDTGGDGGSSDGSGDGSGGGSGGGSVDGQPIQVGGTVQGELTSDAPEDPVLGGQADPYTVTLSSSTSVRISLTSEDLDTYLVVTQNGSQILEDDDGGTRFNSEAVTTLDAGTYTIWAGSWSGSATGTYTLSLERT